MAKRVVTTTEYTDDLDGGKAEGTVSFSFEGVAYEIDLSKANARSFAKELAPYIAAARPIRARRTTGRKVPNRHNLAAVREWAGENGYNVSTRGRIAAPILEAYELATR